MANLEATLLAVLKTTIAGLKTGSVTEFKSVSIHMVAPEFKDVKLTDSPVAGIVYKDTQENPLPDLAVGSIMQCNIIIAARAATRDALVTELLRLKNLVENGLETSVPTDAAGWGTGADKYHRRLEWGEPAFDVNEREPWGLCTLPLEVAFILGSRTSH